MPRSGYILPPAIRLMFAHGLEPVLSGLLTTTLLPFSVNKTVPAALTRPGREPGLSVAERAARAGKIDAQSPGGARGIPGNHMRPARSGPGAAYGFRRRSRRRRHQVLRDVS